MTATRLDITIEQGADYTTPFLIVDSSGAPINVTGDTFAMQIRPSIGDPNAILTLTSATGGFVINGPAGSVLPIIGEEVSTAMIAGIYVYDLKCLSAVGVTSRPFEGTATVSGEITLIKLIPPILPNNSYLLMGVY